jgi:hypothetical protein
VNDNNFTPRPEDTIRDLASQLIAAEAEVAALREALAELRCAYCGDRIREDSGCNVSNHVEARALLASKTEVGGK